MRRDGHFDRFVVFCHRTSILGQWKQAAVGLGLCLEEWPCTEAAAKAADGLLVTYQGAGRQLKSLKQKKEFAAEVALEWRIITSHVRREWYRRPTQAI